jgi:aconitate hydratase
MDASCPTSLVCELTGKRQPGITATDIVLALTEFLRKEKVVGAYLEFHGEGAAALTIGDRATISNMAPEYGATAAMFFIDDNTLDYLQIDRTRAIRTGRWSSNYAKELGFWADGTGPGEVRTQSAASILSTCGAQSWRDRQSAQAPAGTSPCRARYRRRGQTACGPRAGSQGLDAGWRRHHCRDHLVHQYLQPAQRDCRRLAGAQRQRARTWAQALGEDLAGSRLEAPCSCTWKRRSAAELEQLGFGIVAFACTTCNGMSGALDPKPSSRKIIERDLYATAVLSGQSQFRWPHSSRMPSRRSLPRRRWWLPMPLRARCVSTSKSDVLGFDGTARKCA